MIMIKRVVYIATVLLFSGCTAGLTEPDMDFKPPEYVQESPAFEEHSDRQYDEACSVKAITLCLLTIKRCM